MSKRPCASKQVINHVFLSYFFIVETKWKLWENFDKKLQISTDLVLSKNPDCAGFIYSLFIKLNYEFFHIPLKNISHSFSPNILFQHQLLKSCWFFNSWFWIHTVFLHPELNLNADFVHYCSFTMKAWTKTQLFSIALDLDLDHNSCLNCIPIFVDFFKWIEKKKEIRNATMKHVTHHRSGSFDLAPAAFTSDSPSLTLFPILFSILKNLIMFPAFAATASIGIWEDHGTTERHPNKLFLVFDNIPGFYDTDGIFSDSRIWPSCFGIPYRLKKPKNARIRTNEKKLNESKEELNNVSTPGFFHSKLCRYSAKKMSVTENSGQKKPSCWSK